MKICIIGYGSAGQRHANNLSELGNEIIIVESNKYNMERATIDYKTYNSIEDIIEKIDIVFVCTDTTSHISIAQTAVTKLDGLKGILIEKPLSYNLQGVETLFNICKEKNIKIGSACNLLYLSGINLVKNLITNGNVGTIYSASYFFGHNLAKWNDRDYRTTYSAGINGGILLDESHSLYLTEFLFGKLKQFKSIEHRSDLLEIKNEDAYETIGITDNNILVRMHGDYLASEYTRNMEIYGTDGIIQWEMTKTDDGLLESHVYLKTSAIPEWRTFNVSEPLNNMYTREVADFIKFVEGEGTIFHTGISEINIISKIKEN